MADEKKPKAEAPIKRAEKPETPSAIANAEVGEPSDKLSAEELAEVAAHWNAAKRKAHRGF